MNDHARTKRDDELVSACSFPVSVPTRLPHMLHIVWGDVVDYGKKHQDAKAIVRLLDSIRSKSIAIEEAKERDPGSIRVDELRRDEDRLKNQLRRMSSTEDEHAKNLCEAAEQAVSNFAHGSLRHLKEDEDEEAEELVRDRRNPCHHFLIDRLACAPQGARLDDADEVVDGLKEGMEGNLPPEETAQASQASSSLTKKRKRGADRRPRNTAYKARVAGERGSLLRHAQSAASLSSASGAENALAKSHTRLGYRQTLRYFGVGY
ncbi:hypothetical protein OF846_005277 [Rhodotorula toruloides]|nr:hypothetical protein OF846_005277 [Rhodotorula toruloides]